MQDDWKTLDLGENRHLVRGRHGQFLTNANDIYIGRSLLHYGEFSDLEFQVMRAFVRPGDTVVEVGAHLGSFTVPLSKRVGARGRIFAFEPQAPLYHILCANLALNRTTNTGARNSAVGAAPGTLRVPTLDYDSENNFGALGFGEPFQNGNTVPTVTLDQELGDLDLPGIRLIKIDVEGMETHVLRGATSIIETDKPILYLENDRPKNHPDLCDFLLGELGYRAFWHTPPMFNPKNYFGNTTNIFGAVRSLNLLCFPPGTKTETGQLTELRRDDPHPLATTS